MEISNPIATQYIVNQGVASQLNNQSKHLPVVKNERFSPENKIPAPTEDEQRLKAEEDSSRKNTPLQSEAQQAENSEHQAGINQGQSSVNQLDIFPRANAVINQGNSQDIEKHIQPTQSLLQDNQNSPIDKYLENSRSQQFSNTATYIDEYI